MANPHGIYKLVQGLVIFLLLICSVSFAGGADVRPLSLEVIRDDYKNFYLDNSNLLRLGVGAGVAGLFANTSMDADLRDFYQDNIRGNSLDGISKALKLPGSILVTLPALTGIYLFSKDTPYGEWAQKSLRAIITGAPAGLLMQSATGASRPSEGSSKWRPFNDNNGLSGHAFIGAVPFITAAKMSEDLYLKGFFYGLSTLPAITRINDDKHFFSQAALAWYLAYLSADAVSKAGEAKEKTTLTFIPASDGGLLILNRNF